MPALEDFLPAEPLSDEEAREWLATRGVPEFIDEFIGVLIAQQNSGVEVNNAVYKKVCHTKLLALVACATNFVMRHLPRPQREEMKWLVNVSTPLGLNARDE